MIKTYLIDIAKKLVKWDKVVKIHTNGDDNQYPERIDRYINNSVTAKTAANIMIQYLIGKGFGESDNIIINKEKNLKIIDFVDDLATSKVKQRGVFIHVNWNANFKQSSWTVLPFNTCRVGEKDDKDYNGKIVVHKTWEGKVKESDCKAIDVYNPDQKIIEAQVRKASGNLKSPLTASDWEKYKGQILYVNDDNEYIYPLSRIDAVALDCDNEHLSSVYKNRILRKGFFGKTMVLTRPLVDKNTKETYLDNDGNIVRNKEYDKSKSEADEFKKTIKSFLGAENADGVLHMELDFDGEDLEKAIAFKNIESNINDKLFEYTEGSIRKNILIAFNNLPIGLVQASEGIFANSAESLKEMKKTYWENTFKERNSVETILNDLWKYHVMNKNGNYLVIQNLLQNDSNQVSQ